MGLEQSSRVGSGERSLKAKEAYRPNVRRHHTIANPGAGSSSNDSFETGEPNRVGSVSPGPSVCSDVDLPYISYTVNRPIGGYKRKCVIELCAAFEPRNSARYTDSPKLANKQLIKSKSTNTSRRTPVKVSLKYKNAHSIVVIRGADTTSARTDEDPDVQTLKSIPMFLPIMRATLSLPAARDPEVLERLDPVPVRHLCLRYQRHCTAAANLVATEQNLLTQRVREMDAEIHKVVQTATDRQKKFAKYVEKFSKVQELSHQLNKCHTLLNQILESIDNLNHSLDIEDRLEPFVWTTG